MAGPARGSRVVFVGNIPYDMSEEQLTDVFREVGKVVGFRLVNDRDTGKFKGYGFCEFEDPETAASAVRNLNEVEVGGRPLRISFADIDPLMEGRSTQHGQFDQDDLRRRAAAVGRAGRPGTFGHGGTTRGGGVVGGGWQQRPPTDNGFGQRPYGGGPGGPPYGGPGGPAAGGYGVPAAAGGGPYTLPPNLPAGVPLPAGVGSTDAITQTLATLPPNQLLDIMSQMKSLVANSPDQARALLSGHPQLAYALFQAMLMMNVVDPDILQRILAASGAVPGAAAAAPAPPASVPPHMQQPGNNNNGGSATPPQHYGNAAPGPRYPAQARPPPAPYAQPGYGGQPQGGAPANDPAAALAGQNLPEEQKALLMQVLQLTPEQINALPPDQKASIMQLKAQFGQA
ncbi:hypothetical protein EX895_001799 [Sporisorium graminicola]|uniref:RRM domain-containing protein n=1 Tax=Sporisorium graminicola TaxID=280036 RepID=A0A4U7L0K0_9BASI|nr:hypothetical protein EX895_001799 [Sporisorium graminicola]TKY89268.1 hypothetical protein EX895_001799 [Sporisorium graminicola]